MVRVHGAEPRPPGEFYNIVNDTIVPETNNDFILALYDGTYLDMEITIPGYGNRPEFYWVKRP